MDIQYITIDGSSGLSFSLGSGLVPELSRRLVSRDESLLTLGSIDNNRPLSIDGVISQSPLMNWLARRLSAVHDIIRCKSGDQLRPKQPARPVSNRPISIPWRIITDYRLSFLSYSPARMPDYVIQRSISRNIPGQIAPSSTEPISSSWQTRISNWWNGTSASFASYSQLPQQPELLDHQLVWESDESHAMEALRLPKARWRTYWLAAVLCCGGALFGYDSGVIGMSNDNLINQSYLR